MRPRWPARRPSPPRRPSSISVYTFGRFASASSARPSTSFVPSSRTTNGTVGLICSNASISPRATSSQRVMPPKMLNSTALTFGFERITSTALVIASAFEPPPASRKFAGAPPACATTSSVDITSPAPLPRMPMSPSSLTYVSPRSLAIRSCGSSFERSRSSAFSGWRNSALSSSVTFASSAFTWRSGVTISGLTSTSVASSAMNVSYSLASIAPTGRTTSASTPGLVREPAAVEVLEAEQRVDVQPRDRLGRLLRDRLDVHPAFGREHHERRLRRAVEDDRRVVLGGDLATRPRPTARGPSGRGCPCRGSRSRAPAPPRGSARP